MVCHDLKSSQGQMPAQEWLVERLLGQMTEQAAKLDHPLGCGCWCLLAL